ncbi:MAG: hypothetical protein HC893_12490 [Chloroflexaceae bacterium]|nr:hypothetical protein [Chloroflexaceae bacterium]
MVGTSMAHASSDQTPATWRHSAEVALRAARLRCTFPRRAILDWIAAATGPFTAEQLVAALEAQHGSSSRATIYRLLDWLQSAGWLTRIYSDGTQHAYARFWPGHHHTAVCVRHVAAPPYQRMPRRGEHSTGIGGAGLRDPRACA